MSKPSRPLEELMKEDADFRPHVKRFERVVWYGKLFEHVNGTNARSQKGTADGLNVLVWTCAGRTLITIRDNQDDWLSLIVAEDSGERFTMGVQAMSVSMSTAIQWMQRVGNNLTHVVDDNNVGIG